MFVYFILQFQNMLDLEHNTEEDNNDDNASDISDLSGFSDEGWRPIAGTF